MSIIDELIVLVNNLDEDERNYAGVRAVKRMAANLGRIRDNLIADDPNPELSRLDRLDGLK